MTDTITPGSKQTHRTLRELRRAFDAMPQWDGDMAHIVFIPRDLYDRAEAEGYNMVGYAVQEPIPMIIDHPMPTSAEMRDNIRRCLDAGLSLGANHVHEEPLIGRTHIGSLAAPVEYAKLSPSDKPRWASDHRTHGGSLAALTVQSRKHISDKTCHGKDVPCLPGLNGKCTACYDDD